MRSSAEEPDAARAERLVQVLLPLLRQLCAETGDQGSGVGGEAPLSLNPRAWERSMVDAAGLILAAAALWCNWRPWPTMPTTSHTHEAMRAPPRSTGWTWDSS